MPSDSCVKCASPAIYAVYPRSPVHEDLWLGGESFFQDPNTHFLTCAECGYAERYVNSDKRDRIAKYGSRMPPPE